MSVFFVVVVVVFNNNAIRFVFFHFTLKLLISSENHQWHFTFNVLQNGEFY